MKLIELDPERIEALKDALQDHISKHLLSSPDVGHHGIKDVMEVVNSIALVAASIIVGVPPNKMDDVRDWFIEGMDEAIERMLPGAIEMRAQMQAATGTKQ